MTGRCEAELVLLLGVAERHGKYYCFPSQDKILELLDKFNGYRISRRTLNRDLKCLDDGDWFTRVRRTRVDGLGKKVFTSTLYLFGARLFKWLGTLGKRIKRLSSWFRVPKMAHYQAKQKRASFSGRASYKAFSVVYEKDGSCWGLDNRTGEKYPIPT